MLASMTSGITSQHHQHNESHTHLHNQHNESHTHLHNQQNESHTHLQHHQHNETHQHHLRRRRRLGFLAVCTRGGGISVFDYADFADSLLGYQNPLFICAPGAGGSQEGLYLQILGRMERRFSPTSVVRLRSWPPTVAAINDVVARENVSDLYIQKFGTRDGVVASVAGTRNLVHAVMDGRQPHGEVYAQVSASIPGHASVVPHVVRPAPSSEFTRHDLRAEHGVPRDAVVFGRHGGSKQFNSKGQPLGILERRWLLSTRAVAAQNASTHRSDCASRAPQSPTMWCSTWRRPIPRSTFSF